MADLTPNNREEYWLKGMVDGQTTLEPNKRREYWYKEIVDAIGSGGGGGTGGGVLVIAATFNDETQVVILDKTWKEIYTAIKAGIVCVIRHMYDDQEFPYANEAFITSASYDPSTREFIVTTFDSADYYTSSENGYPSTN